jgi:hypothetical protein
MCVESIPTNGEITGLFTREMAALGGTIYDRYDDGEHLYLRSTLTWFAQVRPGKIIRGGVALTAIGRWVFVCPYILRQECADGLLATRHIRRERIAPSAGGIAPGEVAEIRRRLRESISTCAEHETFARGPEQMQTAATHSPLHKSRRSSSRCGGAPWGSPDWFPRLPGDSN